MVTLDAKRRRCRVVYSEEDSGRCDPAVIAHTLDALVWLWRGYQSR